MNKKIKSFLLLILIFLFILSSCSYLANDLQKRKNQNLFNIKIQECQNGTVTVAKASGIKAGEEVILTVTATSGYELSTISVVNANKKDIAVAAVEQGASYKFTMPDSDVTVGAVFENAGPVNITVPGDLNEANGNTLYRIEHYKQDMDDTSTYTLCAIQKKVGDAGSDTAAVSQTFTGYEVVDFAQKKIASDGSTIVEIYYNRKTITYTIVPTGGYWEGSEQVYELTGLYGAAVNYQNYKMNGYTLYIDESIPDVFGLENKTFAAHWNPNNDTKYTVKIYLKNKTGNKYSLDSEFIDIGTTDTLSTYVALNRDGFILNDYEQVVIKGDESSVLKIYYDRVFYTVNFETCGGTPIESQQFYYGDIIQFENEPSKEGYFLWDWYTDSEYENEFVNNGITSSITLYAYWVDNLVHYRLHKDLELLPAGTDGTAGTQGEYVLFGDYPQSLKSDDVSILEPAISVRMHNNKNTNPLYTYSEAYCGSDNNLYIKKMYRGETKYFKVEPLKWRIIKKDSNGKAIMLSELLLFYSKYNDFLGGEGNAFAFNAFFSLTCLVPERLSIIMYEDTESYVYFLSSDVVFNSNLFSSAQSRIRNSTDFSTFLSTADTYLLYWRLSNNSCVNMQDTEREDAVDRNAIAGIVPAITVYLPEED